MIAEVVPSNFTGLLLLMPGVVAVENVVGISVCERRSMHQYWQNATAANQK